MGRARRPSPDASQAARSPSRRRSSRCSDAPCAPTRAPATIPTRRSAPAGTDRLCLWRVGMAPDAAYLSTLPALDEELAAAARRGASRMGSPGGHLPRPGLRVDDERRLAPVARAVGQGLP